MMRGSAIAISVGDRLVRDVEHRDAVPAYAARTAVAPVGIDDVVRIPEGLNEGTLAALLGRRHRGIRKSGGSATCLKVLGILFVVQAATSLYAGSLKTSVSMFGGEGAVGAQEIASSFDWTSLVLGIVLFMLSQLFLYARELYLDSDEIA